MEFWVSVLRVNNGMSCLPKGLLSNLKINATYVRRYNVWLFEGDWETELGDWMDEDNIPVVSLGEIIVPSLGGLAQRKLEKLIEELCPKATKKTKEPSER